MPSSVSRLPPVRFGGYGETLVGNFPYVEGKIPTPLECACASGLAYYGSSRILAQGLGKSAVSHGAFNPICALILRQVFFPLRKSESFPIVPSMEQLCDEITAYAEANGLRPATVVRYAVGANGQTWDKWKSGQASCSLRTAEKIRAYMRGESQKYVPPSVGVTDAPTR